MKKSLNTTKDEVILCMELVYEIGLHQTKNISFPVKGIDWTMMALRNEGRRQWKDHIK